MAYAYEVSGPDIIAPGDGQRYVAWTITETDVSPGDVFAIPAFPRLATLTLVTTSILEPGAGGLSSVQTELSMESDLDPDSDDYLGRAEAPAKAVRIAQNKRTPPGPTNGGTLYGCSHVDVPGGAGSVVRTRVVAVLGHAP